MNICYLIRSFCTRAGTESYVYTMSIALAKLGHTVHIVSLTGQGQRDFKGLEDKIVIHQLVHKNEFLRKVLRLESIFPESTWRYLRLIKRNLPAIIRSQGIDIIEATDWGMDAWAYLPDRQVPVCVRLHGYPGFKDEFDRGILKRWPWKYRYWSIHRKHILSADLVTGVSRAYSDFVRNAWEIEGIDIPIIPIAVDLKVFHPAHISREGPLILFAGRLEKSKGIEILGEAIPVVLRKFPKARFCFAGMDFRHDDRQQTWSEYLINVYGKDHIVYLGSIPTQELVRYYQTAAICVVPSLYEPGGTVAFEAMACGCPVIASRVGGLEDLINDRQTGLLIPPGVATALADGIIELLQKPQLRQELSQKALEMIQTKSDIKRIAQQTLDAYAKTMINFRTDRCRASGD